MSVELRSIRCHHSRATREPCMNPAVVEVLGPVPFLLCAEHAAQELSADPDLAHKEGWEAFGIEEYARYLERAMDALEGMARANGGDKPFDDNPVLGLIIEEATNYLELYELERARRVLEIGGGKRRETARERQFRELFERASAATPQDGHNRVEEGECS